MEYSEFTFAMESAKQMIAFSTAIVTATATFAKDTFLAERSTLPVALGLSWVSYIGVVLFGILTLQALTGEIASNKSPSIYSDSIVQMAIPMSLLFIAGITTTALAGWQSVRKIVSSKAVVENDNENKTS